MSFTFSLLENRITPKQAADLAGFMQQIAEHCAYFGLKTSAQLAKKLGQDCASMINREVAGKIGHLIETIRIEMEANRFYFMDSAEAGFYENPKLLGDAVAEKFPSLLSDIVEAGSCFASSRYTATVFHLMRVMELGVQKLGKTLGVNLAEEKNWQNILNEVNKAIKQLSPKDAETVQLSQAAASLYSIKLAWRNEVMHPKASYTGEEAGNLIQQVRIFMQQLATLMDAEEKAKAY